MVADSVTPAADGAALRLTWQKPFNARSLFSFLEERAVPGLESVTGTRYRRRVGDVWIEAHGRGDALHVAIPAELVGQADGIARRLRRLFDLDADSGTIDEHLGRHAALAALVRAAPGTRVPGTWDSFEGTVRAILGQQVSVARATSLAGVLCDRFGDGAFPDARSLAAADVAAIGLPGMRGRAVSAVAARVLDEGVGWLEDAEALRRGFLDIPGLGPWTAEYAAMRVGRDPDAFPDTDWGVVKTLGLKGAAARDWMASCRPWRAYAVMHLWSSPGVLGDPQQVADSARQDVPR